MKHRLLIILLAALCAIASASGQTIRTLGYNTTNGQVIYSGTNTLTFTNNVNFGGGDLSVSGQTIQGSGVSLSFEDGALAGTVLVQTNAAIEFQGVSAAATRTNLSLGATWLTNTNVTNFRTAIGAASATQDYGAANKAYAVINNDGGATVLEYDGSGGDDWVIYNEDDFRFSVGLSLAALTNTSNVTMMRALANSTNASHPFTGSFTVVDDVNDVATVVVSNGIIVELQFP